jgi:hypothetical protein
MRAPVAFVTGRTGSRVEILVNFGVLTGREATQAEVDRLARTIEPAADELAIVAGRRHEYADGTATVVNLVVLEAEIGDEDERRLLVACEEWVADCAADRRLETLDL